MKFQYITRCMLHTNRLGRVCILAFIVAAALASGVVYAAYHPSHTHSLPRLHTSSKRTDASIVTPTKPKAASPIPVPVNVTKAPVAAVVPVPKPQSPSPAAPVAVKVVVAAPSSNVNNLVPTSVPVVQRPSPPSSGAPTAPAIPSPVARYQSTNWSGYLATGSSYSSVSGSWRATSPSSNGSPLSGDATWIGIGGVTSQDLIQIGTTNTVTSSGAVTSSIFYELLPSSAVYVSSVPIHPGDQMTASISQSSPGQFMMQITDITSGQVFNDSVAYTSSHSSVEWIEEDPSTEGGALIPLDRFAQTSFSSAAATVNGSLTNLLNLNPSPIDMVSESGQSEAITSSINGVSSFTITQ